MEEEYSLVIWFNAQTSPGMHASFQSFLNMSLRQHFPSCNELNFLPLKRFFQLNFQFIHAIQMKINAWITVRVREALTC
ncbi:CLUMA_CG018773, isoform A [Clunio marinus]|uniref:CLUMA_CG018773, isoform A n=1 Tax=Clunio marinus TaxID=568069 RepID=A0A1J1J083_9DIPT|nr:CLUMA_CG018773, isoform A [Clunio marinus]